MKRYPVLLAVTLAVMHLSCAAHSAPKTPSADYAAAIERVFRDMDNAAYELDPRTFAGNPSVAVDGLVKRLDRIDLKGTPPDFQNAFVAYCKEFARLPQTATKRPPEKLNPEQAAWAGLRPLASAGGDLDAVAARYGVNRRSRRDPRAR